MQIRSITIHQFDVPLEEPFETALDPIPELERILVEVETDTGIVGVGEGAPLYQATGETQRSTAAILETVLAPMLVGTDPRSIERAVARMNDAVAGAPSARAAIDIALQDVRGKHAGMPLYELLGGYANDPAVKTPFVLSMKSSGEMAADAAAAVENGHDQIKIKVGDRPANDVERVQAVAEAVPEHVSLKADANKGWGDPKTALEALEPLQSHLDVIEQPIAKEDTDGLALLRDRLRIPVMPDESVETASDAHELIQRGAGDMFNIKLMKAGGITGAVRLNAVAEAANRPTQLGSMLEGHVGTAAGAHFVAAFENVVWNEMVTPFLTTDGITDLEFDRPWIEPSGDGLGVTIDRDRLADARTEKTVVE